MQKPKGKAQQMYEMTRITTVNSYQQEINSQKVSYSTMKINMTAYYALNDPIKSQRL